VVSGLFCLFSGGMGGLVRAVDGDGVAGVLCDGVLGVVPGRERLGRLGDRADADAAVAFGDEPGEDVGLGFGQGRGRAGAGGGQGAADGVQGGGEGDPVGVQAGGGGGGADDGADGVVGDQVGP
jgi:hypothetical protein